MKHRSDAQALIEQGYVRLNRQRVAKANQQAKPGDVLTVTLAAGVKVLRVLAEPERRGPASEARTMYEIIDSQSQKEGARTDPIC